MIRLVHAANANREQFVREGGLAKLEHSRETFHFKSGYFVPDGTELADQVQARQSLDRAAEALMHLYDATSLALQESPLWQLQQQIDRIGDLLSQSIEEIARMPSMEDEP